MRNFSKGQAVIEFALVLPLLLIVLIGIFYCSMILSSYLSLSSMARSSARAAAVAETNADNYSAVRSKYFSETLPVKAYDWDPKSKNDFNIVYDKANNNVIVTMHAALNTTGSKIASVMGKLADNANTSFDLNITYTMYSENKHE